MSASRYDFSIEQGSSVRMNVVYKDDNGNIINLNNGFQLSQIENIIDNIEDPTVRETVKVEWEYAPYVERNHPMPVPLAQALGLTENQVDQAFIQAQYI